MIPIMSDVIRARAEHGSATSISGRSKKMTLDEINAEISEAKESKGD